MSMMKNTITEIEDILPGVIFQPAIYQLCDQEQFTWYLGFSTL